MYHLEGTCAQKLKITIFHSLTHESAWRKNSAQNCVTSVTTSFMRDCLQCQKAASASSLHLSTFTERQNCNINNCSGRQEQRHHYLSHITFQKRFELPPDLYAFLLTINWVYIQTADLEVKWSQQKHTKQLWPSDVDDFISLIGFHWFS